MTKIDSMLAFLRKHEIVEAARLDAVVQANGASGDQALLRELVQRGCLTAFQAKTILAGRGADLLVGPYVILDCIGEGGMGRVFKARHPRLQRIVALKVLRPEVLDDHEIVERFHREIRAVSQLAHPNVVRALDAGPAGSSSFLAMEFVDGIDLARLVREDGPLPVVQACLYIHQAALGLQHIHECGLVHRDIKPPNLLVTPRPSSPTDTSGTVKLLDLGLARFHYRTNRTGKTRLVTVIGESAMIGTPDYLAPEQALEFHSADIRADIYSLGCTLFFLLAGKPPFAGGSLPHKLMRHQQAEPPVDQLRPGTPRELVEVVGRMLAKKPKDRYQSPAELAQALNQLSTGERHALESGQGPQPAKPGAPARGKASDRRLWVRRSVAVVGLLALGILGAALLLGSSNTSPPRATPSGLAPRADKQPPAPTIPGSLPEPRNPRLLQVALAGSRREFDAFQPYLEKQFAVQCARLEGDGNTEISGTEHLPGCDVLVIDLYRTMPSPEQLRRFQDYFNAGKPVVGLSRSTHAFQNWLQADKAIFGVKYDGHPKGPGLKIAIDDKAIDHPLLAGFQPVMPTGGLDVYVQVAPDVQVLMTGGEPGKMTPQTWTRINAERGGQRVFYTRYAPVDLQKPPVRELVLRALFWAIDRDAAALQRSPALRPK